MVAPPAFTPIPAADAIDQYLTSVHRASLAGTLSPATEANYTRDLAEFAARLPAGCLLDDITADMIDDIVLDYAAEPDRRFTRTPKTGPHGSPAPGRGPGAQTRFRSSIARLMAHAARRGWIQQDPMPDTQVRPRTRGTRSTSRTALPEPSALALLESASSPAASSRADQQLATRDTAILSLLIEVGPRVAELCALDQTDLHTRTTDGGADTWLHIRHGKGGKPRDLPLSPATASLISAYLAEPRTAPPVHLSPTIRDDAERALFVTFRGRRITPRDVQNMVTRHVKALPADTRRHVTPHGLRHTAATLLLTSGAADIKTVQAILGHASIATTGLYLDEVSHEMVRAVAAHPVTGKQAQKTRSAR